MRRIFWDTMLFIYLLEEHPAYVSMVRRSLQRSLQRNDVLYTSWLAVGEVMAGGVRIGEHIDANYGNSLMRSLGFQAIPFGSDCLATFGKLRASRIAVADSIHLACAGSTGVDLFITNDFALHGLHVPGIRFISGLDANLV